MSRLIHSYNGYLRSMQMSSTVFFIFVEGMQSDPYFYSRICKTAIDLLGLKYKICLANQLPGEAGGKNALLAFFIFLKRRNALITSLGGEKTSCMFFLDKDMDDFRRRLKRSRHVVYTEYYDVQNYIFKHGDLVSGAASAASVDPEMLNKLMLNDSASWCYRAAMLWREWISLCVLAQEECISCQANFGVTSRVQRRPCEELDIARYEGEIISLISRSGLSADEFQERLAVILKKVDRYFSRKEHHRIFKGKWFAYILADQIDLVMVDQTYDRSGLVGRLLSSIAATIDFNEPWADYFRNRIRDVVALL